MPTSTGIVSRKHADRVRGWSKSLAPGADLLFYGCDFASDANGRGLVAQVARLCGADVAASTDRTANVAQDGDWELEHRVGDVDAVVLLSRSAMESFTGHLAIEINAAGTTGEEVMELLIDDQVVSSWTVGSGADSGQFQSYFANVDGVDVNRIGVRFANDLYVPDQGIDRNLRVNWIRVDGVQYETESPSTFSEWNLCRWCWHPRRELAIRVPAFQRILPVRRYGGEQGSLIEIVARGETGDESMELRIDGNVVQTYSGVSQSPSTYTFQANQSVTADQIQVAFINSFYVPEVDYDQNLVIDLIRIDGVTYQTEAPSTFSTGTWNPGIGITPGNYQTETLHADGYFQYDGSEGGSQRRRQLDRICFRQFYRSRGCRFGGFDRHPQRRPQPSVQCGLLHSRRISRLRDRIINR